MQPDIALVQFQPQDCVQGAGQEITVSEARSLWLTGRPTRVKYLRDIGIGTGLSFRALKNIDWLISYGYGINALREGTRGGHELGLALQREF